MAIIEDRFGDLWIGTWDGGLNRYNRQSDTFTHFKHDPNDPNSISSNTIYSIYEDPSGIIWIGTWEGGLNRYDREKDTFTHFKHDAPDTKGKVLYSATVIPNRGAWLKLEMDGQNLIHVRVDKTRKILATAFLRALGYEG